MSGAEVRLFDPKRDPRDWTDLIGPTQCAVFLKNRITSTSVTADGKPYANPDETACFVFDGIETAREFCESRVQALPYLRCEIYDAHGLAHPPMLVVVHPDAERQEESGSAWSRRRKWIALVLFLVSPPLIWVDVRSHGELIVPTLVAFNCILLAMRFLLWDFIMKYREREREKRLDAHRRLERGDA